MHSYICGKNAELSRLFPGKIFWSGANLHALGDERTRWDGARLAGVRRTDESLARAENWRPAP